MLGYRWGINGQVEHVCPSWWHTWHFRPRSFGILAPPPWGQPSITPIILCDLAFPLDSMQVSHELPLDAFHQLVQTWYQDNPSVTSFPIWWKWPTEFPGKSQVGYWVAPAFESLLWAAELPLGLHEIPFLPQLSGWEVGHGVAIGRD